MNLFYSNYTGVAGWIITQKGEVLLQQTTQVLNSGIKIICCEPIKGGVSSTEFAPNACQKTIREALNASLSADYQRYSLTRLTKSYREIKEAFTFEKREAKKELKGVRWHFFYAIAPEAILNFLSPPRFRLLEKGDWEKVRRFTDVTRNPPKDLNDKVILYDFDYSVLINKIWKIQTTLVPIR